MELIIMFKKIFHILPGTWNLLSKQVSKLKSTSWIFLQIIYFWIEQFNQIKNGISFKMI